MPICAYAPHKVATERRYKIAGYWAKSSLLTNRRFTPTLKSEKLDIKLFNIACLWRFNWPWAKFQKNYVFVSDFESKFMESKLIVAMEPIPAAQKCIKNFEFDQKRSNLYWKWSKEIEKVNIYQLFQLNLTFSIF